VFLLLQAFLFLNRIIWDRYVGYRNRDFLSLVGGHWSLEDKDFMLIQETAAQQKIEMPQSCLNQIAAKGNGGCSVAENPVESDLFFRGYHTPPESGN
jgi:hypothetical protein